MKLYKTQQHNHPYVHPIWISKTENDFEYTELTDCYKICIYQMGTHVLNIADQNVSVSGPCILLFKNTKVKTRLIAGNYPNYSVLAYPELINKYLTPQLIQDRFKTEDVALRIDAFMFEPFYRSEPFVYLPIASVSFSDQILQFCISIERYLHKQEESNWPCGSRNNLIMLLNSLQDCCVETPDPRFSSLSQEIIQTILQTPIQALSINTLCDSLNRSRKYLGEYFKNALGVTPSKFIQKYKIDHAAHQLLITNDTIEKIMHSSGFNDLGYFYKVFNQHYSKAPGEFRKEHSNNVTKSINAYPV